MLSCVKLGYTLERWDGEDSYIDWRFVEDASLETKSFVVTMPHVS